MREPDAMAVPGGWPHPKIQATLLLLLGAVGCAKMAAKGEIAGPGTRETTQPFGGSLEPPSATAKFTSNHSGHSAEFTGKPPGPSAEFTRNTPGPSAEFTSNTPGPSAELASNRCSHSAEFTGKPPGPSAEFTGNTPGPSAEFTSNRCSHSAEFTGKTPSPSAELTSNHSSPSSEFTSNHSGPSAELTSNRSSPSAEFTGNTPGPSAELTSNRSDPSVHLAVHPPTAAQLMPPTTRTLAVEKPVGSVGSLPSTEAAVGLGSSLAGATAAGGGKPVTGLKRDGLKGQVGPGPGQENQTTPGQSGQSKSPPTQPPRTEGADRRGGNRSVPASDPTETPRKDPSPPRVSPSTPPAKGQDPKLQAFAPTPAPPGPSPSPSARPLPVGVIVALLVLLVLVVLALLVVGLHCRRRRRCGSTSFGAGEWAGPVSLPEEPGGGQAGDGGQPAGAGEARRPTLTTFFGKRHSRVASVAMEDVGGAKGEEPLSEPLLATGEQGGDPPPAGAGEANGKVPSMPGPPSPSPDPPANGEFPLPPPMEQEALPPV